MDTQTLLVSLGSLDDCLDVLFLFPSCFIIAPPHGSLILAVQAKMAAGFTLGLSFVTLLTSKTTGEAALWKLVMLEMGIRLYLPDLERLCIFEDLLEGESLVVGVDFFSIAEAIVKIDG